MSVYFHELVGLGGDWCRYILVGWGGWTFFMGGWGYILSGLEWVVIFYGSRHILGGWK